MIKILVLFLLLLINQIKCQVRPNVLLIMLDDFRPAIKSYGESLAITPNIDKLMSQSYYFTNVFAQQALCAPSRNSMLTSRRPDTLHLYDFYSYWRDFAGNFTTLPQYLKSHGYQTESVGKIFHPGISSNFTDDYPLSWSHPTFHPSTEIYKNSAVCLDGNSLKKNLLCPVDVADQPEETLPDIQSMQEAQRLLLKHRLDLSPFFLAVGFHKPHIPFKFPRKFLKDHDVNEFSCQRDQYRPYQVPDVAFNPYNDFRDRNDVNQLNVSYPFGPIPSNFADQIRQHYYAAVTYVDDLIGQLLKYVDSRTIVILTSDHGFQLGEHADWEKYNNYETAVRVPLIIHDPSRSLLFPKKIDNLVELVDLFPTIVDLLNLPKLEKCNSSMETVCTEGKSLVPMMQGHLKEFSNERAFSQYPRSGIFPTKSPNSDKPKLHQINIMGYSIRTRQFRYTAWIGFNSKTFKRDWKQIHGEELYDHSFDDLENLNLADRVGMESIKLILRKQLMEEFP